MPRFTGGQEGVRNLVRGLEGNLDIRRLALSLLREMGGYDGLAHKFSVDYEAAPMGGTTRAKMLSDITKLVLACTPQDPDKVDEEEWTDEELAAQMQQLGMMVDD